jgi:nucleotide-binding universal stress UspA family protein
MFENFPPKSVVVGIDGSSAAVRAARWAVGEVAHSDVPLRLLNVRELSPQASRGDRDDVLMAAEDAVYGAYAAIEAMGIPVKVEMEIIEGSPVSALIEATDSTLLLCIGNTGAGNGSSAGFGSTAVKLVHSAHCSVAIVRGGPPDAGLTDSRSIVAHLEGFPDDDPVVDWAFGEAQRRNAPLVLMTSYRSGFDLFQEDRILLEHDRRMQVLLDRHVAVRAPHYPEVHVRTVTAGGTFQSYLADHASSIQLVIVGGNQACEVGQLVDPTAACALRPSDFSLLVAR